MSGVDPRGTADTVAGEARGSPSMALELRRSQNPVSSSPRRVTDVPGRAYTPWLQRPPRSDGQACSVDDPAMVSHFFRVLGRGSYLNGHWHTRPLPL